MQNIFLSKNFSGFFIIVFQQQLLVLMSVCPSLHIEMLENTIGQGVRKLWVAGGREVEWGGIICCSRGIRMEWSRMLLTI